MKMMIAAILIGASINYVGKGPAKTYIMEHPETMWFSIGLSEPPPHEYTFI